MLPKLVTIESTTQAAITPTVNRAGLLKPPKPAGDPLAWKGLCSLARSRSSFNRSRRICSARSFTSNFSASGCSRKSRKASRATVNRSSSRTQTSNTGESPSEAASTLVAIPWVYRYSANFSACPCVRSPPIRRIKLLHATAELTLCRFVEDHDHLRMQLQRRRGHHGGHRALDRGCDCRRFRFSGGHQQAAFGT